MDRWIEMLDQMAMQVAHLMILYPRAMAFVRFLVFTGLAFTIGPWVFWPWIAFSLCRFIGWYFEMEIVFERVRD